MGAVSIGDRFVFALMRASFKPLVHSPDILARFPEAVVIRAKQNQLPLDVGMPKRLFSLFGACLAK